MYCIATSTVSLPCKAELQAILRLLLCLTNYFHCVILNAEFNVLPFCLRYPWMRGRAAECQQKPKYEPNNPNRTCGAKTMTFTMPVEFEMEVTNDSCLQNPARLSAFKSVGVSLPVYFH